MVAAVGLTEDGHGRSGGRLLRPFGRSTTAVCSPSAFRFVLLGGLIAACCLIADVARSERLVQVRPGGQAEKEESEGSEAARIEGDMACVGLFGFLWYGLGRGTMGRKPTLSYEIGFSGAVGADLETDVQNCESGIETRPHMTALVAL